MDSFSNNSYGDKYVEALMDDIDALRRALQNTRSFIASLTAADAITCLTEIDAALAQSK